MFDPNEGDVYRDKGEVFELLRKKMGYWFLSGKWEIHDEIYKILCKPFDPKDTPRKGEIAYRVDGKEA
ncbi:hypothetical protein LCGC14_1544450 [marine sediment metagenome]|uniref:Uncharacterized protein n=1 Tax=marine sediment metagenome TaxID=412755 RepID=A0A0F9IRZ8_9ZZZZ